MDYTELIAQLRALGIPDWATARHMMAEAATAIEALQAKLATTEHCYEKCFDERAQLEQSVEDLRDSAAVLAKERDTALAKLAELEKQAPVGCLSPGNRFYKTQMQAVQNCEQLAKPLYTSPVPAKTLTDPEIRAMWRNATIEICSHENCYVRGAIDAQTALKGGA